MPVDQSIPKISVVLPSYNHASFIIDALNSILAQTETDYDILIIDDASTDNSVEVICSFMDSHPNAPVRLIQHIENRGGVITLNDLIENTSGEYIALINSDDIWLPEKLTIQRMYLDDHPEVGAVFTQALIIDEAGKVVTDAVHFSADIFIQKNRCRGAWLRRMFLDLNCLCHPSVLIRRSVYREVGLYDPRYRQLPDMQMWIRLLKHIDIHIIEKPLVHLRFHRSNTSQVNIQNSRRNINELNFIMQNFFDNMSDAVFREGFGDLWMNPRAVTKTDLICEQALIYFHPDLKLKPVYFNIGLRKLFDLLSQSEARQVLWQNYQIGYDEFFALSGQFMVEGFAYSPENFQVDQARRTGTWLDDQLVPQSAPATARDWVIQRASKIPILYKLLRGMWRWLQGYKN